MATRASGGGNGSSRARGGAARKSSGSAARKPATSRAKAGAGRGSTARSRPPQKPDPIAQVIFGTFRLIARFWLLIAHTVGSVFRAYGQGARELDPEHRRDGAGMTLLGVAIVLASVIWWRPHGTVTIALERMVRGGFGALAVLLPVL